jgi:protein-disulfide isomerase
MHNNAQIAAEAGQCAHDQGKFWDFHDKMFQNQRALGADALKGYAVQLGLDANRFNSCLDSGTHKERVLADSAAAGAMGLTGTPAFYINGRFLSGAQPFEAFDLIIKEELELASASSGK